MCPINDGSYDQLMAQVQAIKDTEGQNRGSLYVGIVSSVKETHRD
jgi:hypothetical protein